MKVIVRAFANFREILPARAEFELGKGANVADLLELLCKKYAGLRGMLFDKKGAVREYVNIMKSGNHINYLDGLKTKLEDWDEVAIFPPVAGG
jgi:molybdopterin synthase sulfur carrier subunit